MYEEKKIVYEAYKVKVEAVILSPLSKEQLEDVLTIETDVGQLKYVLKATGDWDRVIRLLGLKGDVEDHSDLLLRLGVFMITDDSVIEKTVEEIEISRGCKNG